MRREMKFAGIGLLFVAAVYFVLIPAALPREVISASQLPMISDPSYPIGQAAISTGSCSGGGSCPLGIIRGTVMYGPTQPVCQQGVPCYRPYADFVVNVYDLTGTQVVASAKTDAAGHYEISLPAGRYVVYQKQSAISGGEKGVAVTVTLIAGQAATVDIDVDSGIR